MTLTLSQLESHLWESANILRGPVDAADFKSYVFPLLFFKRISDVHDDMFTIDYGHPFGGETLTCDVKVEPAPAADVASAKE